MDVGNLRAHALRHRWPLRLIVFERFMAVGRALFIEHHGHIVRPMVPQDLQQHRREAIHRIGLQAFGIGQGRQGEECPIDVGAAVDEIECGHS